MAESFALLGGGRSLRKGLFRGAQINGVVGDNLNDVAVTKLMCLGSVWYSSHFTRDADMVGVADIGAVAKLDAAQGLWRNADA